MQAGKRILSQACGGALCSYGNMRPVKRKVASLDQYFRQMGQPQSQEAVAFLNRLLNLDPKKRMTASDGYAVSPPPPPPLSA